MTLPLETINGKQYQPVRGACCDKCVFVDADCKDAPCVRLPKDNDTYVYFIEPGDTNE